MKNSSNHKKAVKLIPLAITFVLIILCAVFLSGHDFHDIINYTPDNLFLASFVIILMYGVKSLSVVFPLTAFFVATGIMYTFPVAVLVNLCGLTVCFTTPYFLGKLSGSELIETLSESHPKVHKIVDYSHHNNLFASYISRAVVVVPGDVVSMVHGALGTPYKPYIIGSLMGVLPEMLVQTYVGDRLNSLTLNTVIVLIALILLTLLFSVILNKKVNKHKMG